VLAGRYTHELVDHSHPEYYFVIYMPVCAEMREDMDMLEVALFLVGAEGRSPQVVSSPPAPVVIPTPKTDFVIVEYIKEYFKGKDKT
jgi:hypothetical protein